MGRIISVDYEKKDAAIAKALEIVVPNWRIFH